MEEAANEGGAKVLAGGRKTWSSLHVRERGLLASEKDPTEERLTLRDENRAKLHFPPTQKNENLTLGVKFSLGIAQTARRIEIEHCAWKCSQTVLAFLAFFSGISALLLRAEGKNKTLSGKKNGNDAGMEQLFPFYSPERKEERKLPLLLGRTAASECCCDGK